MTTQRYNQPSCVRRYVMSVTQKRHLDEDIFRLLGEIELKLTAGDDVASAWRENSSIIRLRPTHRNHVWAIDFVHDKLSNGRSYKMLTVLDEFTRQALAVTVRTRMGVIDVLEVLYPLLLRHGSPECIRSDNGPEFAADALQDWLRRVGIQPIRIYPGPPKENGYNERLNGTLRREFLNAEWFTTTEQAQIVISHRLKQYNHTRPHQALNMRPPVPETLIEKALICGPDAGG